MIEKTFKCSESHLREMISFIMRELKSLKIPEIKSKRLHVIAEEILTNIISYAYDDENSYFLPESEKTITLKLSLNDKKNLACSFIDKGKSFDFYSFLKKASPMKKPQIGGVGIHLISKFADSIEYVRKNEKNILTVSIKSTR